MKNIYCRMDGQDRVEIVAFPLHPALIEVTAWLYSDEARFQKNADASQCSILGYACCGRDSVITGMADVRFAILDQQQICIDHERRWREVQQKDFIGQREIFFTIAALKIRSEGIFVCDKSFADQGRQIFVYCICR